LRNYVLRGWDAEGYCPRDVENEARVLMRYAFMLAEVYPSLHRNEERPGHASALPPAEGSAPSGCSSQRPPRPPWLEPSLLHVLFVSRSPDLAEALLDGLRAASPLASVVADSHARDGGVCAAAIEAGFRSYAFIDAELRMLRLWTVSERELHAAVGIEGGDIFFDLIVWLVEGQADDQAALPPAAASVVQASKVLEPCKERLAQELKEARAAKQAAAQDENFELARSWKAREAELEGKLRAAEAAEAAAEGERRELREALEQAHEAKRAAVAAEEFKEAQQWKVKEKELEAQLAALNVADTTVATSMTSSTWHDRLAALTGTGSPPLLVVGVPAAPRDLRAEAVHAGLAPDRIWTLPRTKLGQRPGLCEEPGFWAVVEAALQSLSAGRSFPEELPRINLPSDTKLGASVRLRYMEGPSGGSKANAKAGTKDATKWPLAAQQELNGRCGTVIGYEGEGPIPPSLFLVRLWDGEVIHVVREQFTLLSFKLGASSPVQLNNMQRMRVRLKDLKSKPELNGREGDADDWLSEGRYTVVFKEGGHVAAKPENVEVLEPSSNELQGCVGLVDARDGARGRYKVLLVKTTDRTEERSEVRLHGLRAKPALNGQEAIIDTFNPRTERYTARLKDGSGEVAIKRQNFEFIHAVRIEAMSLNLPADRVDYFLDPEDEDMLFDK